GQDLTSNHVTQQQGRDGQTEWLALNDVQTPNNLPGTTVDVGTAGQANGLTKAWTMQSSNLLGGAIGGTRNQWDEMQIPTIGRLSPWTMTSDEHSSLVGPDGTHQIVDLQANGHADGDWTGQLFASLVAGSKSMTKTVNFSGHDINATLFCEQ